MSTDCEYSFEHGIDDCGRDGIAPVLAVGHRVTERDFFERDLSGIRGVSVSQRGLSPGTVWKDLDLAYLFARLRGIEFLRIHFDDAIDLRDVSPLPALRELEIDAPKVKGVLAGAMPQLRRAFLRWPEACTAALDAPGLEWLELRYLRSVDLSLVAHLCALHELRVVCGRSLVSIAGVGALGRLERLTVAACPNLRAMGIDAPIAGPKDLSISGCLRFDDASDASKLGRLRHLSITPAERGSHQVKVPRVLQTRGVQLSLGNVTAIWV
jgi:hypothetical protein